MIPFFLFSPATPFFSLHLFKAGSKEGGEKLVQLALRKSSMILASFFLLATKTVKESLNYYSYHELFHKRKGEKITQPPFKLFAR